MHNLNLQNQQSSNKEQRQQHQHESNGKNAIRTINECKLQTAMQLTVHIDMLQIRHLPL